MWDTLLSVDWKRTVHAYGAGRDVPDILRNMVSPDESVRKRGWSDFDGALNHQGDVYDSTVACAPFLLEALKHPETPDRARILTYFRERWLDAELFGADPLLDTPPGGVDLPTPFVTDADASTPRDDPVSADDPDPEEDPDPNAYRRMDLCAWQLGRSIHAGQPVFVALLDEPDPALAAAAAALLLLWPDTRPEAKQRLKRLIESGSDPAWRAARILEFGVYGDASDVSVLRAWTSPVHAPPMRAAAALAWAWAIHPDPPPDALSQTLEAMSAADCDSFISLPRLGLWRWGAWFLPANAAHLAVRLAQHPAPEARWRAIQAFEGERETARHVPAAEIAPVLLQALSDPFGRIRTSAAKGLAALQDEDLLVNLQGIPALIAALEPVPSLPWGDAAAMLDDDGDLIGQAATLLATLSARLSPAQRQAALDALDRAARRPLGMVSNGRSSRVPAEGFLKTQRTLIETPAEWTPEALFADIGVPPNMPQRLSPGRSDRLLAKAYAAEPERVMAIALNAVRTLDDRNRTLGAIRWLTTLGPAAADALPLLEHLTVARARDIYLCQKARSAADFLRASLRIATVADGLPDPPEHNDTVVSALTGMLNDDAIVEVGVRGEYVLEGRLYHWRRERRSPRRRALLALHTMDWLASDDRILTAMLAEAIHPVVLCGDAAEPPRFPLVLWRRAMGEGERYDQANQALRQARQACQTAELGASACHSELTRVLQSLSGRLIPPSMY